MRSHEHWLEVVDSFASAAFQENLWYPSLERLAAATGSRCGQLIGLGEDSAIPFNLWTDFDPEAVEEFAALGYGDPALNPRVRAGASAPELTPRTEADFLSPEEFRNNESYQWGRRHDIHFSCLTPLVRNKDMLVGLAVIRSGKQGHISDPEKTVFTSLAPHVRSAVRTQMLLEDQAALVLTGAFEAMSLAAFVCDVRGRVTNMTPAAERLLTEGYCVTLNKGFLTARVPEDDVTLATAIRAASAGPGQSGTPLLKSLFLRPRKPNLNTLIADVITLPARALSFSRSTRVLVVVRGEKRTGSSLTVALQSAFALTAAEAEIALLLSNGNAPADIATHRGVSVGTVRIQIKSIYEKLGVNRQAELMARLRPVL